MVLASLPKASAIVDLLKPITWSRPMWALACGAVASSAPTDDRLWLVLAAVVLAGPLLSATSQAINAGFDSEIDVANKSQRPIPSGRMRGRSGLYGAMLWTQPSLAAAWACSAPPLRLKKSGRWDNPACSICIVGLAWVTVAAVMVGGAPSLASLLLAALYGFGAHGAMTLNDFKSIESDKHKGIGMLPAQLGSQNAARVACAVMVLPQLAVIALLLDWGHSQLAAGIGLLLIGQGLMMRRFLAAPIERALWYSGLGVPLFVLGMLVSAFALRAAGGMT